MQKAAAQHRPSGTRAAAKRQGGVSIPAPGRDHLAQLAAGAAAGLPAPLKQSIEALSGVAMDHVQVHRNSTQPARLNALAFAQGSAIHLAPGREQHLAHEAWHVVQQAQGRVRPTARLRGGVPVNDETVLEREADRMGARALQMGAAAHGLQQQPPCATAAARAAAPTLAATVAATVAATGPSVQRTEESARLLTELAVPQIKPGPTVEVQKALVKKLDENVDFIGGILNLGGILIDAIPEKDDDLVEQARLVALPTVGGFISAGSPRGDKVLEHHLDRQVIENTLRTMIDAQQIAYLRLAGLPDKDWKILIEVQYYRERDMTQTGFHKDTLGETLFVNLNYHMDRTVVAPEYVINPAPSQAHDDQTANTLPLAFRNDLAATRLRLAAPTTYQTGIAEPYDYVAFVDEAIHHATPYYHHRYVTGSDLADYLQEKFPAKLQHASSVYKTYQARSWYQYGYGFSSYLDTQIIPADEAAIWQTRMALIADAARRLTRHDLQGAITDTEFDAVLTGASASGTVRSGGASAGFHKASIPGVARTPSLLAPIHPGRPTLTRRLSNADFRKTLPAEPPQGDRRAFFRTWVRVVPEDKAKKLRG